MYTIPGGVQAEAKKALKWRAEHNRGGTPVGLNTARTLARGGQIGIKKIRHIAKYFPRHEVDKKGKGWDPGEDNFPSNGRIAWALWGGDPAWRWARTIVERENKKALTAGGYNIPGYDDHLDHVNYSEEYDSDVSAFRSVHEMDENYGPEFMIRVCGDGSGIDRLYKIDIDGRVYVWDDGSWDDLGDVYGDVYIYDQELDDDYDEVPKTHLPIDPGSAIIVSALMQERPFQKVLIEEIDPEEAKMVAFAMADLDFGMIDRVITAAVTDQDGNYTPEERSEKAENQPRDASGRFAAAGNRVVVAGDVARGSGVITKVDSNTGMVTVKLDSGKEISVDAKFTRAEDKEKSGPRVMPDLSGRLDVSGILGEPRTPINMPKAHLPGTLPPITSKELQLMLNDWPAWVKFHRASFKPLKSDGLLAAAEKPMTPDTTDVPAKYLAIVSPDDPQAVMDLVALVPASATSTEPATYKREKGKWVLDEQILRDLKSPTPPPVVKLEGEELLNDVLQQVDNIKTSTSVAASGLYDYLTYFWYDVAESLQAAGGLDRNRGNAEELRRYWTRGLGALKIRWGTPGDWTRCVRFLSKYMGPRAKGYCQLRHKEVTGVYTGSKYNVGKGNKRNMFSLYESEEQMTQKVIEKSALAAQAAELKERIKPIAAGAYQTGGAKFTIPLLIPEDVESGDGRKFKKDSIKIRELPLPLLWQIKTGDGHDGSVVVGRIDYMEKTEDGIGNAYGVFDSGPYGREAERLVRNGFIRGVSADLDQFEAKEESSENADKDKDDEIGKKKITINQARVMAATIVAKPAFQECVISVSDEYQEDQEEDMIPEDGIYEESFETFVAAEAVTASGFLLSEIPVAPPKKWFENPKLTKPTPIIVGEDGRIYGHIAAWHVNHIGMPKSTRPPRSRSKYAYFHTGVVRTDDGSDVPVGQLTLAGGHASLYADASAAAKHYDDTASAIADVHAGEDDYGIWVAGSLRPDATEAQIRTLRASAPSGDWRPINGSLELVAVCQVNVPGFPIARAVVASGKVMALVAAGASYLAIMKSEAVSSLSSKANKLGQLAAETEKVLARAEEQFGYISKSKRKEYAKEGWALPDGSYPIKTEEDLKRAIYAYGRSNPEDRAKVRTHIRKRARALGRADMIPENWKAASALIASYFADFAQFTEEERKKLAESGEALPDGSYPIRNEKDLKNAIKAYGRSNPKDRAKVRAHIRKRAKALGKANLVPENWKSAGSMDAEAMVASMRAKISEFVEAKEPTEEELEELKKAQDEADKEAEKQAQEVKKVETTEDRYDEEGRVKYTPRTQPRDAQGKYRKVLARLRQDLGVAGLQRALQKVQEAENLDFAGNYAKSAQASADLIGIIDRLDTKALNPKALENVKNSARELGRVISNLPLPFGQDAEKIRFSDLPSGLRDLIENMITRVEAKIGKEDADIATADLRSYMSGADVYSQGEVQSQMSKLLRLLT
jgi:hypothetical protein